MRVITGCLTNESGKIFLEENITGLFLKTIIFLLGKCVGIRCTVWDEMILLPFGEVVSVSFERLFLILGGYVQASHTPAPLERGGFGWCFLFGNELFEWGSFPS